MLKLTRRLLINLFVFQLINNGSDLPLVHSRTKRAPGARLGKAVGNLLQGLAKHGSTHRSRGSKNNLVPFNGRGVFGGKVGGKGKFKTRAKKVRNVVAGTAASATVFYGIWEVLEEIKKSVHGTNSSSEGNSTAEREQGRLDHNSHDSELGEEMAEILAEEVARIEILVFTVMKNMTVTLQEVLQKQEKDKKNRLEEEERERERILEEMRVEEAKRNAAAADLANRIGELLKNQQRNDAKFKESERDFSEMRKEEAARNMTHLLLSNKLGEILSMQLKAAQKLDLLESYRPDTLFGVQADEPLVNGGNEKEKDMEKEKEKDMEKGKEKSQQFFSSVIKVIEEGMARREFGRRRTGDRKCISTPETRWNRSILFVWGGIAGVLATAIVGLTVALFIRCCCSSK